MLDFLSPPSFIIFCARIVCSFFILSSPFAFFCLSKDVVVVDVFNKSCNCYTIFCFRRVFLFVLALDFFLAWVASQLSLPFAARQYPTYVLCNIKQYTLAVSSIDFNGRHCFARVFVLPLVFVSNFMFVLFCRMDWALTGRAETTTVAREVPARAGKGKKPHR